MFWNSFLLPQSFLGYNAKSTFFKKKWFLKVAFIKIDVYVVTNMSVPLEKYQTIEILLMLDFVRISKMMHFFLVFFF